MKSYTNIDQSKKLLAIGIPAESADMWYEEVVKGIIKPVVGDYTLEMQCREDKDYLKLSHKMVSPAWSLSALLELMPSNYSLQKTNDGKYFVVYDDSYSTPDCFTPVGAAVEMVELLKKQNLI